LDAVWQGLLGLEPALQADIWGWGVGLDIAEDDRRTAILETWGRKGLHSWTSNQLKELASRFRDKDNGMAFNLAWWADALARIEKPEADDYLPQGGVDAVWQSVKDLAPQLLKEVEKKK
jgi:hypothetical protein